MALQLKLHYVTTASFVRRLEMNTYLIDFQNCSTNTHTFYVCVNGLPVYIK